MVRVAALNHALAGRYGIKYIFLTSVIGFTLASALCGAATSPTELVSAHRIGIGRPRVGCIDGEPHLHLAVVSELRLHPRVSAADQAPLA
jgi:hypothetical protein